MKYPGYLLMSKQTKNKIVPKLRFREFSKGEKWIETSLNELGKIISGLTYRPDDVKDQGLLVLRSSNVKNGEIVLNDCVYVDPDIKGANLSEPNDILICVRNGSKALIGKNALIPDGLPTCTHGAFMTVLRSATPRFVYQLFQSDSYFQQVNNDLGATINSINGGNLLRYKFYVPEPPEQQKIADCLSSLDELITAESQNLEAFKEHKKGLLQQLFPAEGETVPKRRFAEFKDSGGWVEISFIDVADKNVKWSFTGGPFGSNLKSSDYVTNTDAIRIIQLQNIGDGEFHDDYKIFTSKDKAEELLSCNIYPGEIILSKMGDPVGRACLIPKTHARYVMCSDGIRLVVDEKKYSKYFIYTLINSEHFRPLVGKTATGSTRKRIGLDDLKNLSMVVPSHIKEQHKIAGCLFSLDELIKSQAEKIDALKEHKKGLMQQLFPEINETL